MTIYEACQKCHNFFDGSEQKYFGKIVISGGALIGFENKLKNGQYFRIVGSTFNDGVYKYPASDLTDETFEKGAVWGMAIPKEFLLDVAAITEYEAKNADAIASPLQSESFHSYSRTFKTGGSADNSDITTLQGAIASRLARWTKL